MRKALVGIGVCLLMVMSILSVSGMANAAGKEQNLNSTISKETGTTTAFGGGDYVFIRFGTDAAFGVLWGTEQYQNSIIMLTVKARYLGVAKVYDDHGALISSSYPIKVYTVYGVKLEDMFEFNDTNKDGLCNYIRDGIGLEYKDYIAHEPIYKKVSMTQPWVRSNITETTDQAAEEKTWEFSLNTINAHYKAVGDSPSINYSVNNQLMDSMKFTFHLSAKLVQVNNATVPQYKVTVQKGNNSRYEVIGSERLQNLTVSGKMAKYRVKWDHDFYGWDFDPTNTNKALLMEFHALIGNFIPKGVAEWLQLQFANRVGDEGQGRYQSDDGRTQNVNPGPIPSEPKKLRSKWLEFGGNWTSIGRLTWVSNVTVDGQEKEMYAQIQGGRPLWLTGEQGNMFIGFAVLGGLSYPGGTSIIHDPALESTALYDIVVPTAIPWGLIGLIAVVVIVVVIVALVYTTRHHKGSKGYEENYDENKGKSKTEWSEYYEQKK